MAYNFRLIAAKSKKYLMLDNSQLNNVYIDRVAKGNAGGAQIGLCDWVSYANPASTADGYSTPIKLYSPVAHRFLGSTEQIQRISGTTTETGEILGTIAYGTADNALEFIFQRKDGKYLIWLSEHEDPAQNTRSLLYDKLDSNRIVVTKYNPISVTTELDNLWSIEQIAL